MNHCLMYTNTVAAHLRALSLFNVKTFPPKATINKVEFWCYKKFTSEVLNPITTLNVCSVKKDTKRSSVLLLGLVLLFFYRTAVKCETKVFQFYEIRNRFSPPR